MLGYKDMTFCADECSNKECFRQITEEVKAAGKRWWGSEDFPMYQANFKHTCGQWMTLEEKQDGMDA
jgi:hypothetical protein